MLFPLVQLDQTVDTTTKSSPSIILNLELKLGWEMPTIGFGFSGSRREMSMSYVYLCYKYLFARDFYEKSHWTIKCPDSAILPRKVDVNS